MAKTINIDRSFFKTALGEIIVALGLAQLVLILGAVNILLFKFVLG